MGQKQCPKCSEMVDEAKAFCPGCGNAFVEEEQRQQKSEFERMDNTVQFGQTMYNQMLSDMGLNISKPPQAEKRIEVIAPAAATVLKPAVAAAAKPKKPTQAIEKQPGKQPGNAKWYILGGVLVVLIVVLTVAVTALLYLYWTGYRF